MKNILLVILLHFILIDLTAQTWTEIQKIVSSDRGAHDQFGVSVSINNQTAIVGAWKEDHDTIGLNKINHAGAAYIFERDTTGYWNEAQKLIASDRSEIASFGYSVAIDQDYLIIGARGESKNVVGGDSINGAGAAYIFRKNQTGKWTQIQKLVASDRGKFDFFGSSVAIHNSYLIIGAYWEDHNPFGQDTKSEAGAAYIFERDSTGYWTEVQKIVPLDREVYDQFGFSVSIEGNTAIVGAYTKTDSIGGIPVFSAGAVYIFERNSLGEWVENQKVTASDKANSDYFGTSVAISGNTILVGAYGENDVPGGNDVDNRGAAYFLEKNNLGQWEETQKVIGSGSKGFLLFGYSVSLDGDVAIIGTPHDFEPTILSGSAFIFERKPNGIWYEAQKLTASDYDIEDKFGWSVAISGTTALVGAFYEDEDATGGNTLEDAGSAYIFERWAPVGIDKSAKSLPLKIYPNPTEKNVTIELGQVYQEIKITVRNVMGQVIVQEVVKNADQIEVELEGPAGVYLVETELGEKGGVIWKVVKK
ncbi:MAG: T9SS type A sorting domain-containing protein [Bacteroidetes bacterium]|nr:T9SS type A sorting domain-containing protein [Bacteroidota bacterium]